MAPTLYFIVPGSLDQLTGGYLYDRRIVDGLRTSGWSVHLHELVGTFPLTDYAAQAAAAQTITAIPNGARVLIDGLAMPACIDLLAEHAERLRFVALVHLPLAAETHLSQPQRERFERLERTALALVHRIIVTSPHTASVLISNYAVSSKRIGVVLPGTEPALPSPRSGIGPINLLCVASVTPRKGHAVLIEALATLMDLDWQLLSIGSLQRDPAAVQFVTATIARYGLEARITLVDERPQEDIAEAYQQADVFVLASYYETYGMVLSEALAHGLPIVSTTGGAIPDTVPATAGLLVPPGDVTALAQALRRIISDRDLRQCLATEARQAHLPRWSQSIGQFAAELEALGP